MGPPTNDVVRTREFDARNREIDRRFDEIEEKIDQIIEGIDNANKAASAAKKVAEENKVETWRWIVGVIISIITGGSGVYTLLQLFHMVK